MGGSAESVGSCLFVSTRDGVVRTVIMEPTHQDNNYLLLLVDQQAKLNVD